MKEKSGMLRIIPILLVVLLIFVGCSYVTTRDMLETFDEGEQKVQEFLVGWPDLSGVIDGLPQWAKDYFFTEEAKMAKKILDELSTYCTSLRKALSNKPPDPLCDFKDWQPQAIIPPNFSMKAMMQDGKIVYTYTLEPSLEFGKQKVGKQNIDKQNIDKQSILDPDGQKNQYVTGFAGGITATMASEILLKQLKEAAKYFPELKDVIKYLSVLL